MAELGHFALILGVFVSAYAVLVDLLGSFCYETGLLKSGRNATLACWFCVTIAVIVLSTLLIQCDFSIKYVAEHTSKALPLIYRLSAFWAGAAGSLLLWLWIQVGFVVIVFSKTAEKEKVFASIARAIANFVCFFFLIILIVDKNPFDLSNPIPDDGAGLNPLLQHPAMALHPPTLFIGYAAFIIPFAWAFATLKGPRPALGGVYPLFVQARNWTLIAWLFLTIGIVLGAWWAYEELGWGGYWAWDPVENSSLMPWLTGTALLHCLRTYKPRSAIARWLTILSLVTFSLCIFGTFLTRYGLVTSVHAFPEPGLGILFLVLLVNIGVAVAVLRLRKYRYGQGSDSPIPEPRSPISGRRFIAINSWLMVLLTFVIFIGTLFPYLSGLFTDHQITLKSDYFTKVTAPLGLAVLLLLGLCPYLLRYGVGRNRRIFGAVLFTVAAVTVWLLTKSLAIPCFIICGFAAINLAADFFGWNSAVANNQSATGGFGRLKGLRWYGARIAHTSVVLIFIGIAGSGAYETEKHAALVAGQNTAVGKFDVKFEGLRADHGPNFTAVTADITVSKGTKHVARLNPSQAYYYGSGKQTSEVDIKRTLSGDIYVALTAVDRSTGLVNIRVLIKPFINLIWIGSTALVLGAGLVLVSFYRHKKVAQ